MQKGISTIDKTLVCGGRLSLAVLDTTALVNEAISRHALTPVAAAALGRTMTGAAYLCSWLKEENAALSVSVDGGGIGGKICVAGDARLRMRGFLGHPEADLPPRADGKLDVGGFVGRNGYLSVTRDEGEGLPFTGTCALVSGEIAEDFSAYFLTSEQRPTAVALGVRIGPDGRCLGAGGVFLQPLPGAGEEAVSFAEKKIGEFSDVSLQIASRGAEGILSSFDCGACERREIVFRCHCTRERAASAVVALGRAEAESILASLGEIGVHCDYCNTDYRFTESDVDALFTEKQ